MFTEFMPTYDSLVHYGIYESSKRYRPQNYFQFPTIEQQPIFPIFQTEGYQGVPEVSSEVSQPQLNEQEVESQQSELQQVEPQQPQQVKSASSSVIDSIVNLAKSLVGGKYKYGGIDPKVGLDCSGLVYYVYKQNGIDIPRTTKSTLQSNKGIKIDSLKDVKKGDAIITPGGGENKMHDQIAIEDYNPETGTVKVVSASNPKKGIVYKDIGSKTKILGIKTPPYLAEVTNLLIPKYKYLF